MSQVFNFAFTCQKSHEEQSRFERDRISQAKLIMKPFILRRVKNEVSSFGKVAHLYLVNIMRVYSVFCNETWHKDDVCLHVKNAFIFLL